MGHLEIELGHGVQVEAYRRELDLKEAICRTSYEYSGVPYTGDLPCSADDQVMVVRLEADKPASSAWRLR